MAHAQDWLIKLRENPLALGILAFFACLSALEFTVKYALRSAKIFNFAVNLGISSISRTFRRQFKKNFLVTRKVRTKQGFSEIRANAKKHRELFVISSLAVSFMYLLALSMKLRDPSLFIASSAIVLLRTSLSALLTYQALKIAEKYARDPGYWRNFYVSALRAHQK